MAYYNVCPDCGCNLDPGEKCDCKNEKAKKQEFFNRRLSVEPESGQFTFVFDSKEVSYACKVT